MRTAETCVQQLPADNSVVDSPVIPPASPSQVPGAGLKFLVIVVGVIALVALYANVQRARRDTIETVTITRIKSPSPPPAQGNR